MKIIQFSDSFLPVKDGVGTVVYQYALQMAQKGHEVYVVAPQTDTGFRGKYPFEMIDYIGFQLPSLKSYKAGIPGLDPNCQSRLNMIDADVVHVHTPFMAGQAGINYAQNHKVPLIGTFHSNYYDDILQETDNGVLATIGSRIIGGIYNRCDEVWAVSKSSRKNLRSYHCNQPIRVMPNGTDILEVSPKREKELRKEYGLSGMPVFLYVGQINWKKNIRCILEAAAQLPFDFRLLLAGSGPHEAEIRELAESLALQDKVLFTGFIKDAETKNALYAAADLFLFPSLYDTFGLVVCEAAAAGTPAVAVRGSGAAEGMKHLENGFLCRNDPKDLARVITEALQDPVRLAEVGTLAKETLPVSWDQITDKALNRYKALIRSYQPKPGKKKKKKKDEEKGLPH